jgi:arsenate reductase
MQLTIVMKILFICTHNRCRSILAEAVTNHVGHPHIQAVSGGSSPQGVVHPLSLEYLFEHGVSTQGLISQSWDDFEDFSPDAVITLCDSAAKETCPVWFGDTVQVHWGLEDPSKLVNELDQEKAFKNTISVLERRVQRLLETIAKKEDGIELRTRLNQIATDIY